MTILRNAILAAIAVAASASTASAAIVCNEKGDCWHARERYAYKPEFHLSVHPDNWKWRKGEARYHWREHAGRGYWRDGVWIGF